MLNVRLSVLALAGLSVALTLQSHAVTLVEDFSADPATQGWLAVGQTNLFAWNSTNRNLEVTWDSSQPNSYFCHPLGTTLTASDDFCLAFDLLLNDITPGANPDQPYAFELSVGLVNLAEASGSGFLRSVQYTCPDLVEFDYWPDDGSGYSSLDGTMSDTNGTLQFNYSGLPLEVGKACRVGLSYTATNKLLRGWVSCDHQPYAAFTNSFPRSDFGDFRVDHVAVCSYSDAGQDPMWAGSLLAHGVVDNFVISPPPTSQISGLFTNGTSQVQFLSQSNWFYTLECSTNLLYWESTSAAANGNGTNLVLQDTNPPSGNAFYRVRAD